MQAGTPVTLWDNQSARSVFSDMFGKPTMPAEAAINFFTEFSNPAKKTYSWNRSLPSSVNYFLSGDLALYFGFADEIQNLQLKNPNLNFDVAPIPVSREGGTEVSYANMNAFAITKSSKNISPAFSVISALVAKEPIKILSDLTSLPSARRDLLSQRQTNSYLSVFWDGAIRSRGWLDPSPESSDLLFKDMIQSITSGRVRTSEAVNRTQRELSSLFGR
jgi:ABC-type glycerol-3-phosphate transport system substrate-binding protein